MGAWKSSSRRGEFKLTMPCRQAVLKTRVAGRSAAAVLLFTCLMLFCGVSLAEAEHENRWVLAGRVDGYEYYVDENSWQLDASGAVFVGVMRAYSKKESEYVTERLQANVPAAFSLVYFALNTEWNSYGVMNARVFSAESVLLDEFTPEKVGFCPSTPGSDVWHLLDLATRFKEEQVLKHGKSQ